MNTNAKKHLPQEMVSNHLYETSDIFEKRLSCHVTIAVVTTVAHMSLRGNDDHTPSRCHIRGSQSNSGIKNMTCRVRLRNIDLPTLPMDWNRVVETT